MRLYQTLTFTIHAKISMKEYFKNYIFKISTPTWNGEFE